MKQVCVQHVNLVLYTGAVFPLSSRRARGECKRRKHHIKQETKRALPALFLGTVRVFKESLRDDGQTQKTHSRIEIGLNTFYTNRAVFREERKVTFCGQVSFPFSKGK